MCVRKFILSFKQPIYKRTFRRQPIYHSRIIQINLSLQKLAFDASGSYSPQYVSFRALALPRLDSWPLISHWMSTKVKWGVNKEECIETSSTIWQFRLKPCFGEGHYVSKRQFGLNVSFSFSAFCLIPISMTDYVIKSPSALWREGSLWGQHSFLKQRARWTASTFPGPFLHVFEVPLGLHECFMSNEHCAG